MGPVNWIAVVVAGALAAVVLHLCWRGDNGWGGGWIYLIQQVPAAMLGHALARIGPDKLALKPQLYAMQSGGLALAIAIPALWLSNQRHGVAAQQSWRDCAAFLCAYLVMGAVFWAMG